MHVAWGRNPTSFYCKWIFSSPSSTVMGFSWHSCGKSIYHKCKSLFLTLNFALINMCIFMTRLFCPDYCSFVVNFKIELWTLQICSSFSRLLLLFWSPAILCKFLDQLVNFCTWQLGFWPGLCRICRSIWRLLPFLQY